jgi:hypothetical protein
MPVGTVDNSVGRSRKLCLVSGFPNLSFDIHPTNNNLGYSLSMGVLVVRSIMSYRTHRLQQLVTNHNMHNRPQLQ